MFEWFSHSDRNCGKIEVDGWIMLADLDIVILTSTSTTFYNT